MNIDWSKAPEGATHWDTGLHGRTPGWMRLDETTWYWWPVDGAKCERKWFVCCETYPSETKEFVARPTAWSGEGKPPVGTVCEYLGAHQYDQWSVASIFAHWKDMVFVDFGDGWRQERDLSRFRPIRTPEQIAAEERENSIQQMIDDTNILTGIMSDRRIMAGQLYDAGYRKQVSP
jgi:hypothetical protein